MVWLARGDAAAGCHSSRSLGHKDTARIMVMLKQSILPVSCLCLQQLYSGLLYRQMNCECQHSSLCFLMLLYLGRSFIPTLLVFVSVVINLPPHLSHSHQDFCDDLIFKMLSIPSSVLLTSLLPPRPHLRPIRLQTLFASLSRPFLRLVSIH